jgi:hypothetical protein
VWTRPAEEGVEPAVAPTVERAAVLGWLNYRWPVLPLGGCPLRRRAHWLHA